MVPSKLFANPPFDPINLSPFSVISISVTSKLNISLAADKFEEKKHRKIINCMNFKLFFINLNCINKVYYY